MIFAECVVCSPSPPPPPRHVSHPVVRRAPDLAESLQGLRGGGVSGKEKYSAVGLITTTTT